MKRVNHLMPAVLILMAFALGSAQTVEFQEPWKDVRLAIVIDPYQGNEILWADVATDPRVAGIIHRATIGKRKDTKYAERKAEARLRGYRWGSYHLGKPGNPIKEADFYLDTVKP